MTKQNVFVAKQCLLHFRNEKTEITQKQYNNFSNNFKNWIEMRKKKLSKSFNTENWFKIFFF